MSLAEVHGICSYVVIDEQWGKIQFFQNTGWGQVELVEIKQKSGGFFVQINLWLISRYLSICFKTLLSIKTCSLMA